MQLNYKIELKRSGSNVLTFEWIIWMSLSNLIIIIKSEVLVWHGKDMEKHYVTTFYLNKITGFINSFNDKKLLIILSKKFLIKKSKFISFAKPGQWILSKWKKKKTKYILYIGNNFNIGYIICYHHHSTSLFPIKKIKLFEKFPSADVILKHKNQ